MNNSMMMDRKSTAYRLAECVVASELEMHETVLRKSLELSQEDKLRDAWRKDVLRMCEEALGAQDRIIEEYRRILVELTALHTRPLIILADNK